MVKNRNNPIVNAINESDKDIILVGTRGTGKTTVINDLLKNNKDIILVDGTLKNIESIFLKETNIYNLYQTCLIIKKILSNIKSKYLERHINDFSNFEMYIDSIIKQIYIMGITNIYDRETSIINEKILNRPELLLDRLLNLISKKIDIKDLILVIDDFDEVERSSQRYQKFIYNRIKSYLRLVITISDKSVVNNIERLQKFSNDNEIIKLDYSKEVSIVKEIFNDEISNNFIRKKRLPLKYNLYFVLDDETIQMMIEKTNGNLFDMLNAIRNLYDNIEELKENEYNSFILNYIDNIINNDPMITGIIIPERELHINPMDSKGMF